MNLKVLIPRMTVKSVFFVHQPARMQSYENRRQVFVSQFNQAASAVRLSKDTSNLFRDRTGPVQPALNARDFNHVLQVNSAAGWVETEGL